MSSLLLALLFAGPSIEGLTIADGRRAVLSVTATVVTEAAGEVRLEGDVNGRPVLLARRLPKAGAKPVKFRLDPRSLGILAPDVPLRFALDLVVEETGGARAEEAVERTLPVPLAVLHGLGQEVSPGALEDFAAGIDLASPSDWSAEGVRPDLLLHHYRTVGPSLPALGKAFAKALKRFVKKSGFGRADVVAYSMGGLVTRSAMTQGAGGLVRRVVFTGTPNEGTPVAYLGVAASDFGMAGPVPGVDPALADLLLDPAARTTLVTFFPTYPWHDPFPVLLEPLLPDPEGPLAALNALGPVAGVDYHAISYSGPGTVEYVDSADILLLLGSGLLSPEQLAGVLMAMADGAGDGVVPLRSVFLRDEPAWSGALTEHDLGPGTHTALPEDPAVLATIAGILDL
ncbi:MAG: alpha/beta hydrolase [Planctomycetes bacterium]|jgi:pimeloyl-ACP methyl ester carboxylesterase|nr:alpha/beta hydrolase [Planctomycetota bacterium]